MSSGALDINAFTKPFQLTKGMHRELYPAVDPSNSALKASGKVVIITGAGGGVGAALATAWATAGADGIVLVGRTPETLDETAQRVKSINGNSSVLCVKADLTSESDVKALYEKVKERFGKADVLINCAGTMNFDQKTGDIEPSLWWQDYEVNVKGSYLAIHYFIKLSDGKGTIINLATVGAGLLAPGISSYASSKLALIKFGEFLQIEHPELRVFSVHPGLVEVEPGQRGIVVPAFTPFAKDKASLVGGVSLYLSTPKADYLRGGFVSSNWDVEEMEAHQDEIAQKGLLKLAFLHAKLGPDGHPWGS